MNSIFNLKRLNITTDLDGIIYMIINTSSKINCFININEKSLKYIYNQVSWKWIGIISLINNVTNRELY